MRSWPELGAPVTVASGPDVGVGFWERELLIKYLDTGGRWTVTVQTTPSFAVGRRELLVPGIWEGNTFVPSEDADWNLPPGVESQLVIRGDQGEALTEVRVVENWFEELERLVPTD